MIEKLHKDAMEIHITAASQSGCDFYGLWEFRGLLYWLAWRDIKTRYRQTHIGALFVLLQPFSMMLVITLALGFLAKVPSEGLPYSLFVMSGLVPWILFTAIISQVSISLITNSALISKIYFPRLVIPLSTSVVPLIDCLVTFFFFMLFSLFLGFMPKSTLLISFFFIGLCYVFALGIGFWCAALNVRKRDIQYFVPLILQIGVYISPVMYPVRLVPDKWKIFYTLNPMVSIIEGFRWAIYDIGLLDTMTLMRSGIIIFLIFISGFCYFQVTERTLVDAL